MESLVVGDIAELRPNQVGPSYFAKWVFLVMSQQMGGGVEGQQCSDTASRGLQSWGMGSLCHVWTSSYLQGRGGYSILTTSGWKARNPGLCPVL